MNFSRISLILTLLIIMSICGFTISYVDKVTREPISQVNIKKLARQIKMLMPLTYDNDLLNDTIQVTSLGDLGTSDPVLVYRARLAGQPRGIIILPDAPDGYNGPIKLAISLDYQGKVLSVNILKHHETPGFGDKIHQEKSDWIKGFNGKVLTDLNNINAIDQISGASVSSIAVTRAVIKSLDFYNRERGRLWKPTTQTNSTK